MRDIGPGHNSEDDTARRWRMRRWQAAKSALRGPTLSPVQKKLRMNRAQELGLSYQRYNSLMMATGRDPRAFLLTPDGMGLRLERRLRLPKEHRDKLGRLRNCKLLALSPEAEPVQDFLEELREISALPFLAAVQNPGANAGWGAIRAALLPTLKHLSLPGDATVVIGGPHPSEPGWASAIRAGFLPGATYFGAEA